MAIRNNLGDIRLKLGFKRSKEFAKLLNISPNQYSQYENNVSQPSLEVFYFKIYPILHEYGYKIDDIIYEIKEQ